jgi:SAM-dependent methyltransferase
MSTIQYDPVKDKFARIVKKSRFLRRLFYFLLDLFFLRSWHIRQLIKSRGEKFDRAGTWTLLDAGCGFGQYDRFLLSQFDQVQIHSVDVKEDYLKDNRYYFEDEIRNGRIQFYKANLLDFQSETQFDMIICIDVLEHIEDDIKVMKNLYQCLNPGGYFIMHSPSHYSEEDADGDESFVGEHARPGYSKEELTAKLDSVGFIPETIHYTYGFWGHKAWVFSVKWPMLWLNKLGLLAVLPLLIYYPLVLPFCLVMNLADLYTKNKKGNGVYAVARKPG